MIFTISIFGHAIWDLKIGPKVAYMYSLSTVGGGVENELIFALRGNGYQDMAVFHFNYVN